MVLVLILILILVLSALIFKVSKQSESDDIAQLKFELC